MQSRTISPYSKSFLVVDDDRDVVESIISYFSFVFPEHTMHPAYNGNEAVRLFEVHRPELMILDMMLPGRSGFKVMDDISAKDHNYRKEKRFVMITGNPGKRHQMYAEAMGAGAYFVKPVKLERLAAETKRILDGLSARSTG